MYPVPTHARSGTPSFLFYTQPKATMSEHAVLLYHDQCNPGKLMYLSMQQLSFEQTRVPRSLWCHFKHQARFYNFWSQVGPNSCLAQASLSVNCSHRVALLGCSQHVNNNFIIYAFYPPTYQLSHWTHPPPILQTRKCRTLSCKRATISLHHLN